MDKDRTISTELSDFLEFIISPVSSLPSLNKALEREVRTYVASLCYNRYRELYESSSKIPMVTVKDVVYELYNTTPSLPAPVSELLVDIVDRIHMSGLENNSIVKVSEQKGLSEKQKAQHRTLVNTIKTYIGSSISAKDLYFIIDRAAVYVSDFSFNESSDMSLLNGVIVDELMTSQLQTKLFSLQMSGEADIESIRKITNILNESSKKIQNSLKTLGLTAEQRSKKLSGVSDNLCKLAAQFDNSIQEFPIIEKIYLLEEIDILLQKRSRNEITDLDFKILLGHDMCIDECKKYMIDNLEIYKKHLIDKFGSETAEKVLKQILGEI